MDRPYLRQSGSAGGAAAHELSTGGASSGTGTQYLLRRRFAVHGRQEVLEQLLALAEAGHARLGTIAREITPAGTEVSGLAAGDRSLISRTASTASAG